MRNLNYRQAISKTGVGEGKLIRRTAHEDQYAHIKLAVEPLGESEGTVFAEQVTEHNAIPEKFLSHIEMACLNAVQNGLWGFPLADVRIRILDGSYHDIDSSKAAFEEATRMAIVDAMLASSPHVLEPCLTWTVRVPEKYLPNVVQDINARRALILRIVPGPRTTAVFSVPEGETLDYISTLASLSGGCGILSIGSRRIFRELPDSLIVDRFCTLCMREMRIPLIRGEAFSNNCLICGTPFGPPDLDTEVGVLSG